MDSGGFTLRWEEDSRGQSGGVVSEDVICTMDGSVQQHFNNIDGNNSHLTNESIIADTDQIAAENLIFLAQDIVGQIGGYAETAQYRSDGYTLEQAELEQGDEVECQVTEEIITDDWVQPGGQEQVEVPLEQLVIVTAEPTNEENSIDVPLPTDQDEYTAMRPYPCDFCSRRFRKKANLMNHMVAHQNDRPFGCNLCGTRYGRRSDLLNHLKSHASVPEDAEDVFNEFEPIMQESPPRRRHRRRSPHSIKNDDYSFINDMETSVAARTQQYDANAASSSMRTINQFQVTDPSRPFVCQHCGIGFAREKALASHARIHGGDSPIECGICGEMCWSREQLSSHTKHKHPYRTPQATSPPHGDFSSDSSFDDDYVEKTIETQPVGPELICKDCGVGFQRVDLLRRHVRAAHRYKMEPQQDLLLPMGDGSLGDNDPWGNNEHSCSQCGERFREPLDLLAHAGTHAGQRGNSSKRASGSQRDKSVDCNVCGERFPDKMALISHRHIHSGNSKQFPCRECGKTFGSRSSQQIHERIHTGERPYSCRFCWKAFADGGTLRKHERIHTGEKPYACAVCPRAFNQRVVLREHVRSHHSAADNRRGTATTPFWCSVCGQLFAVSGDLVQHIIGHCDANTAMKRQPQVGPRKYKRRRKTAPFDDDMNKDDDDDDKIDSDMSGPEEEEMLDEEIISPRRQSTSTYRRSRKRKPSPQSSGDEMDAIRASLERSSRLIESSISGSARTKGKTKSKSYQDIQRPKMIHTQRTKITDGDSPVGKRKKRMTTTTITATTTHSSNPTASEERVRARIKNVKLPGDGRLPKASFSTSVKPEPETESDLAADLTAILHGSEQLEEVEEEIIEMTFEDPKLIKKEPSHDNHELQSIIKVKCEKEDANSMMASMNSTIEVANSESGPFRCEMCSESFPLREELLVHVPIHIT